MNCWMFELAAVWAVVAVQCACVFATSVPALVTQPTNTGTANVVYSHEESQPQPEPADLVGLPPYVFAAICAVVGIVIGSLITSVVWMKCRRHSHMITQSQQQPKQVGLNCPSPSSSPPQRAPLTAPIPIPITTTTAPFPPPPPISDFVKTPTSVSSTGPPPPPPISDFVNSSPGPPTPPTISGLVTTTLAKTKQVPNTNTTRSKSCALPQQPTRVMEDEMKVKLRESFERRATMRKQNEAALTTATTVSSTCTPTTTSTPTPTTTLTMTTPAVAVTECTTMTESVVVSSYKHYQQQLNTNTNTTAPTTGQHQHQRFKKRGPATPKRSSSLKVVFPPPSHGELTRVERLASSLATIDEETTTEIPNLLHLPLYQCGPVNMPPPLPTSSPPPPPPHSPPPPPVWLFVDPDSNPDDDEQTITIVE